MAAALVEVQRDAGGLSDHLRSYEVVIDQEVVGQLSAGESQAFEVDPGSHELFLKVDWCRSEKIILQLNAGQTVIFRCAPNANLFTEFYRISFGRHRYIKLTRVGS
jgi:hypothetical protein